MDDRKVFIPKKKKKSQFNCRICRLVKMCIAGEIYRLKPTSFYLHWSI